MVTVLEIPELALRIELRKTAADTGGQYLEADLVGRPQGFIAQAHVHPHQKETLEVIEGRMALKMEGYERVLDPGEVVVTPPGVAHRHTAAGDEPARIRVTIEPAGRTQEWLERLVDISRSGGFSRKGFPRPVAGARLIRDFEGEGHAAFPSERTQRRIAGAILAVTRNKEVPAMSATEMLEQAIAAFNRRDWDAYVAPYAPDPVLHGLPVTDLDGMRGFYADLWAGFPDVELRAIKMLESGDHVTVIFGLRGTHDGEFNEIPASGRQVDLMGITTFRLADGKVVERWQGFDNLALLEQLGAVPSAA